MGSNSVTEGEFDVALVSSFSSDALVLSRGSEFALALFGSVACTKYVGHATEVYVRTYAQSHEEDEDATAQGLSGIYGVVR